jgi:hypothetical protein
MQSKIIELKTASSWVLINRDNIRSVEFAREERPYADRFAIIILYIDRDEDEDYQLTLNHKYTEDECREFRDKLLYQ